MAENDDILWGEEIQLPRARSTELRGKQSVRATFKLTAKAIDALSIVSVHLGIKQKSLFDHLIEDAEALDLIAREIQSRRFRDLQRVQKTFVLSRRTLSCLEQVSQNFNTPRDALVEYSIQRLLPVIAREKEKHRQRKALLAQLRQYIAQGNGLLQNAEHQLGEDDPVFDRLAAAFDALAAAHNDIEVYVRKGSIIEKF